MLFGNGRIQVIDLETGGASVTDLCEVGWQDVASIDDGPCPRLLHCIRGIASTPVERHGRALLSLSLRTGLRAGAPRNHAYTACAGIPSSVV